MDTRSITEAVSNAVSTAVTDALSRVMPSNPGESSRGSNSASEGDSAGRKRGPSRYMPSSFLKKKHSEKKGKEKKKTWTKDIVCLPKDYSHSKEDISIPKGAKRTELAKLGLVGKISLQSSMSTEEVKSEVRSVFKEAMGGKESFQFKFLQPVGGGCKSLFDPQTSSSFEWTAKDVVQSSGRGAVYIVAEDDLVLPDDLEAQDFIEDEDDVHTSSAVAQGRVPIDDDSDDEVQFMGYR